MKKAVICILSIIVAACASWTGGPVEYAGAQKNIFSTGKAERVMSLTSLSGRRNLFAVGAIEGLEGEITIFESKPYISKVQGADYAVDKAFNYGAVFLVWASQSKWQDVSVPASVKSYIDLQKFIKTQALASGVNVSKPFPFLLAGSPAEIKWHINTDSTDGRPVTMELFAKSKVSYITKNEPVDIIGFYSETHKGVFISQYCPGIKPEDGVENAIHIHFVSRSGRAAGHIDDLTLEGGNMVLRLPES